MASLPALEELAAVHGHTCPGLAIGYKIVRHAVKWAGDEDNISVYSTSTRCPLDALRIVFHLREHPERLTIEDKQELHFVLTKPDGSKLFIDEVPGSKIFSPEGDALRSKVRAGTASADEIKRFDEIQADLLKKTLETPDEQLFTLRSL